VQNTQPSIFLTESTRQWIKHFSEDDTVGIAGGPLLECMRDDEKYRTVCKCDVDSDRVVYVQAIYTHDDKQVAERIFEVIDGYC